MKRRRSLDFLIDVSVMLGLFALCIVLARNSTSFAFPPVSEIATSFKNLWLFDRVPTDLLPSLGRLFVAYTLSTVLGITLGVALASNRILFRLCDPVLQFIRAIPSISFIPIFLYIFGIGPSVQIVIIISGSIWPILLNTLDGIRAENPVLVDTCTVFRLSPLRRLFQVTIPAVSPQILAGMRTGLAIAFIVMVASEMTIATNGVGYIVVQAQRSYMISDMWSGIILLSLIGYLLNMVFQKIESRLLHWHPDFQLPRNRKNTF